ncbi:hypothetical protein FHS95_000840 [Sphingomonas naasensis]|nr:hypothetical protein [Sphingomonas naasensis]
MFKRSLLQSALLLAPLSAAITAPVPAIAQKAKIAPDNSVMGVRLHGKWQDDKHEYHFTPLPGGKVQFRQIVRETGREYANGILEPALTQGAMIGTVRYVPVSGFPADRELKAWVADNNRLWMNGANATPELVPFSRIEEGRAQLSAMVWKGKWQTNLGLLEIATDGFNFFGWITHGSDPRKERVAFKGDEKTVSGAWDSEFDVTGTWIHKPARWGDLTLTLSADANSFTGTYSANKAGALGMQEFGFRGERVDKLPGAGQPQTPREPTVPAVPDAFPAAEKDQETVDFVRLTGRWNSTLGTIEIMGGSPESPNGSARLSGRFTPDSGKASSFVVRPAGGELIGQGGQDSGGERRFKARLIDDRTLELSVTEGAPFSGRMVLTASRVDDSSPAASLSGDWETSLGRMTLRVEGAHLTGTVIPDHGASEGRILVAMHHFDGMRRGAELGGAWKAAIVGVEGAGTLRLDPSADGKSFSGSYTRMVAGKPVEQGWSGRKIVAQTPAPTPAPASVSDPRPAPAPSAPTPGSETEAPAGDYQPLGKWDVRLDRVENPRDDRLTHVYLTLRNPGTRDLLQTEDVWVYLEAGGVEQRSGQGLRAEPGYPKLFGSPPPVVRAGKEIRTKFVFDRQNGGGPMTLTIEEGGKQAVYDF